jgi:nucleoside 2-deoxyribosyltransferase
VDRHDHNNKIDDEIISQIRRSRLLIADFTGHRNGVYFEVGFAMGLGIPVFFTCRSDNLKDLHFDVRQYNTLEWSTPTQLAVDLQRRISAVIGDGPSV